MARNKYRAIATVVDGIRFHSKKEARRYSELKLLENAGLISHLELQPEFPINVNGDAICKYIADFRYIDNERLHPATGARGCTVVEDVKGMKTPIYKLKKRLTEATYKGVIIEEV